MDRFAAYPALATAFRQMRRRLEKEVVVPPTNTKTAPGGYYDIDFALSFLRLRGRVGIQEPGTNMAEQIVALRSAGVMGDEDSKMLSEGANFLRSVDHAVRLVTGRAAPRVAGKSRPC